MSDLSYASDLHAKTGLRPSRQAIKRAALALALTLGVAVRRRLRLRLSDHRAAIWNRPTTPMSKPTSTIISPKVSGYIAEVLVGDNQPVKAGQLLARIDDRDFRTALDQAHADVAGVRSRGAQPRCADRAAAAADRTGHRRRRRRRSHAEIRAGRTGPLRRPDEDRLRHHPARAADRRGAARKDRAVAARQIRPAGGAAQGRCSHHRTRQGRGATGSRPRGRSSRRR